MRKTVKPPKGSDSLMAWGTTASGTYGSTTTNQTTGLVQPLSQSRVFVSKEKPLSGSSPIVHGWRKPTVFRSYACKMIPGPTFKYKYGSGTIWQHEGSRGYNPAGTAYDLYLGCYGSGRFPRTSENLVNRAEVECMNKLKDASMNLGESIATMNQTISLIADTATALSNLYKAAKGKNLATRRGWEKVKKQRQAHNKKRKAFGLGRMSHSSWMKAHGYSVTKPKPFSLSDFWLQYTYAWTPLLNDIQALIGMAKHGISGLPVKAIRNLTEEHALPQTSRYATSAPYVFSARGNISSGVKVRIDARVTNSAFAQLDAHGLINPSSLAWELIPFSFVIDWLVPIGASIKSLSTPVGLDLRSVSVTRYTTAAVHMSWYQYKPVDPGTPITCNVNSLSTWRTIRFTWPWSSLYWKSPFTSASRAATALALLSKLR